MRVPSTRLCNIIAHSRPGYILKASLGKAGNLHALETMMAHKLRRLKWSWAVTGLLGLALWLAASPAHAATVTYALDYIFSPATGSVTPLGTVTLTDLDNAVQFDVLNQAGTGTKLDSLYFNFTHGSLIPNQLLFSSVSAASGTYSTLLASSIGATDNSLKADGDGYFSGKLAYSTNNFLGQGQTLSFRVSAAGQTLSVADFHFFSLPGGGAGSYIMASHVQNMPLTGSSVWVGTVVPIPAAAVLFGSGLLGLVGMARRSTR
mgnify:CR=1 FL=1